MPDISDVIRLLSYYQAGGGKTRTQAGDILSALGQAAGGIGEGISKAYAPKLALIKQRQEIAAKTLDAALTHGNNQFKSEDINKILTTGNFPSGINIGENKKTLYKVYNPNSGEYDDISLPEGSGYTDLKVQGKPIAARPESKQASPRERALLNTLRQADTALAGGGIDPKLRKAAMAAATSLGIDSSVYAEDAPPPEDHSPNWAQTAWEGLKSGSKAVVGGVAGQVSALQKKLSERTTAAKGSSNQDDPATAYLTSIKAKITPKNIAWAKTKIAKK